VHAAALPGVAQFVGRHRHRAEGGGRLALQEAEALGQLGRHQVAQRPVVDQHQQPHAVQRLLGRGAHRHVAGDHGQLGLEVDAPASSAKTGVVGRAQEVVAAALVHQRVGAQKLAGSSAPRARRTRSTWVR
jgi:hypothetical protein